VPGPCCSEMNSNVLQWAVLSAPVSVPAVHVVSVGLSEEAKVKELQTSACTVLYSTVLHLMLRPAIQPALNWVLLYCAAWCCVVLCSGCVSGSV
jgi:hypothetical protein